MSEFEHDAFDILVATLQAKFGSVTPDDIVYWIRTSQANREKMMREGVMIHVDARETIGVPARI